MSLNPLLLTTHSATSERKERERGVGGGGGGWERATNPSPPSAQTLGFTGLSRRPEVCMQSTTAIYDLPQCTISLCGLLEQRQHNPTVAALFEVICCHSEGKVRGAILAKKKKINKKCVFGTGGFYTCIQSLWYLSFLFLRSQRIGPFLSALSCFSKVGTFSAS